MKIGLFKLRSRRWIVQVRKLGQFQDFSWFLHIVTGDLRWSSIKLEKLGWKLKTLIRYHEHLKAQLSMLFIAVLCLPTWHTWGLQSIQSPKDYASSFLRMPVHQFQGKGWDAQIAGDIIFHSTASWLSPFQSNSFGVGFHSVSPTTRWQGTWDLHGSIQHVCEALFQLFALMLCMWWTAVASFPNCLAPYTSLIFRSPTVLTTNNHHFCPPKHRQGFPALKGPCGFGVEG